MLHPRCPYTFLAGVSCCRPHHLVYVISMRLKHFFLSTTLHFFLSTTFRSSQRLCLMPAVESLCGNFLPATAAIFWPNASVRNAF